MKEHHPGRRKALSVPFKAGSELLPGVAVRPSYWYLSFLCCTLNARHGMRELSSGTPQSSFCALKAGSELLPVRSGAANLLVFKLSQLYAKHKARNEPHHTGRGKALSMPYKAGSELLPVRSGAAKFPSFKLSPLYAEHTARKEPRHLGRGFLSHIKLEVNFFQCVACGQAAVI
jgi:hypothetical protein